MSSHVISLDLSEWNHPNLVSLRGVLLKPPSMVLEWCPLQSLDLLLVKFTKKGLHLDQVRAAVSLPIQLRLVLDIARGLAYLHGRDPPVAHRDLRSPNIFVRPHSLWRGQFNSKGHVKSQCHICESCILSHLYSS